MKYVRLFAFLCASAVSSVPVEKVENGDDIIADQIIDPEELGQLTTPAPLHTWDSWEDWDSWESPKELIKWFPYYKLGYDHNGLAVYVMSFGKWNYRELAHQSNELNDAFWMYFEQFLRRINRDAVLKNHQGIVYIVDWEGFSLGHYASSKALQLALKMFAAIVRFNNDVTYGIQINMNFAAETFLNIARPFMGNLLEKFEEYGTRKDKWVPALLRKIPSQSLPPYYGGDKDWKPAPFTRDS